MASSKTAPAPAIVTLSVLALSITLAGCQRNEPLPADKTLALIKPVARVEVSEAPAAPAPVAPASAAPVPAVEPAAASAAPAAPAPAPATPAAPPAPAAQKGVAGGRMVLGEVAFEGSGAALPAEAGATVESVAGYVTANPGVRIEIATHADKAGADLAKERAQAVRAALLGAGVKEDQVVLGAPAAGDGKAAQRVELLLAASAAAAPASAAATAPAAAAATGGGAKADGNGIYDKTCVTCHSAGVAGAPKVGDKAAWAPRLAGGVGALVQSAIKGKGAMPPKGGNAALSEAEIKAAVEHMVASSK